MAGDPITADVLTSEAVARDQIRQCLALAAIATDRMDWDLLADCYTSDATVDLGGFFRGSISEYIASNSSPSGLPSLERTMHALTTSAIDVRGDRAVAESYCTCYHSGPPDHPWCAGFVVVYVRFLDELTVSDGRWRITRRRGVFEWGRNETTGAALELDPESLGRRDRSDARYQLYAYAGGS